MRLSLNLTVIVILVSRDPLSSGPSLRPKNFRAVTPMGSESGSRHSGMPKRPATANPTPDPLVPPTSSRLSYRPALSRTTPQFACTPWVIKARFVPVCQMLELLGVYCSIESLPSDDEGGGNWQLRVLRHAGGRSPPKNTNGRWSLTVTPTVPSPGLSEKLGLKNVPIPAGLARRPGGLGPR